MQRAAILCVCMFGWLSVVSQADQISCLSQGTTPGSEKSRIIFHKTNSGRVAIVLQKKDNPALLDPFREKPPEMTTEAWLWNVEVGHHPDYFLTWYGLHSPVEKEVFSADFNAEKLNIQLKRNSQPPRLLYLSSQGPGSATLVGTWTGFEPVTDVTCRSEEEFPYFAAKDQLANEEQEAKETQKEQAAQKAKKIAAIAQAHTEVIPGEYAKYFPPTKRLGTLNPKDFFLVGEEPSVHEVTQVTIAPDDKVERRRACLKVSEEQLGYVVPEWDDSNPCSSFNFRELYAYHRIEKFRKDAGAGEAVFGYSLDTLKIHRAKRSILKDRRRRRGRHRSWGYPSAYTFWDNTFYSYEFEDGSLGILKVIMNRESHTYSFIEPKKFISKGSH